jgi:hypothetical protein
MHGGKLADRSSGERQAESRAAIVLGFSNPTLIKSITSFGGSKA